MTHLKYYCPQYYCPQNPAPYHTRCPNVLCAMPGATRSTCIDHCSNANNILCAAFESVNEHFHADTTIKGHAVALLATTVMAYDRVDSNTADYLTELSLSAFHLLSSWLNWTMTAKRQIWTANAEYKSEQTAFRLTAPGAWRQLASHKATVIP